jgi:hypothetical protein
VDQFTVHSHQYLLPVSELMSGDTWDRLLAQNRHVSVHRLWAALAHLALIEWHVRVAWVQLKYWWFPHTDQMLVHAMNHVPADKPMEPFEDVPLFLQEARVYPFEAIQWISSQFPSIIPTIMNLVQRVGYRK